MEGWATYVVPWGAGSGDMVGSCAMIRKVNWGILLLYSHGWVPVRCHLPGALRDAGNLG